MNRLTIEQQKKLKEKLSRDKELITNIDISEVDLITDDKYESIRNYKFVENNQKSNEFKNFAVNLNFIGKENLLPEYDVFNTEIEVIKKMREDIYNKKKEIEEKKYESDDDENELLEIIDVIERKGKDKIDPKVLEQDLVKLDKAINDKKIIIDGRLYPSITYYVYMKLYSLFPENKFQMKQTYDTKGVNKSLYSLQNDYIIDRTRSISNMLRDNLRYAMIIKFKDIYTQEVLRLTGNKKLFYDYRYQSFNNNYIGKELQKYRDVIVKNPPKVFGILTLKNSNTLIAEDEFIRKWIMMRANDYHRNIELIIKLFEDKGIDTIPKSTIAALVLKYMYNPVNLVSMNAIKLEKQEPSDKFVELLNEKSTVYTLGNAGTRDFSKTDELTRFTYIYIVSLLNFLSYHTENNVTLLKQTIFDNQVSMSNDISCDMETFNKLNTKIFDKKSFKCVLNAYKNLMIIINKMAKEVNTGKDNKFDFTLYDLITIEKILFPGIKYGNKKEKPTNEEIFRKRNYPRLNEADEKYITYVVGKYYNTTITDRDYKNVLKSITAIAKVNNYVKNNHINYYANLD